MSVVFVADVADGGDYDGIDYINHMIIMMRMITILLP